ncbi:MULTISPECIES: hypothetical protein [unclassified Actinomadura]|uniref:hypothetical protein n=1 Tax=unclassified Actinomadura TaxID=2626254 RepID=UPI0011EE46EB|nr:hypothetical protein [Actinomadura sp. K4S16]
MPYPITEQCPLAEARKHGRAGFKRKQRVAAELPPARPHQAYVFQIGDRFTVLRHPRPDHPDAIEATSVSVVDMAMGVSVAVRLPVASQDAQTFQVDVMFDCTVVDASRVVKSGLRDVTAPLEQYLREHNEIFEVGLRRGLAEWKEFKLDVTAQIKAYAHFIQPTVPGMRIALAAVDVQTPPPISKVEGTLGEDAGEQRVADQKAEMERDAERRTREFRVEMQEREREAELRNREERAEFARTQLDHDYDAIGNDPVRATILANQYGAIGHEDVAVTVGEQDRREEEHREKLRLEQRGDAQALLDREERLRLERRADYRAVAEQEHEDKLRREVWDREEKLAEIEAGRKDMIRRETWDRQDRRDRDEREHQDRLHALDLRLNLLREIAKHGYLDQINVDVEGLIKGLQADSGKPAVDSGQRPEIVEPSRDAADDQSIEDLTEDDDDY